MKELIAELNARARDLGLASISAMYEDPFWMERFGERGRKFSDEDAHYHVTYLAQALAARDVSLFENYLRWVQNVLTSRGMCSRHLAENLRLLAERITAERLPDAGIAVRYLDVGAQALRYQGGPAAQLQEEGARVFEQVASGVLTRHSNVSTPRSLRADLEQHLSYLEDALALDRRDLFISYVRWMAGFLERHGTPREVFRDCIAALGMTALAAGVVREALAAIDNPVPEGAQAT